MRGLPLVAGGGGHSPVGVRRLPTAVASLAMEHGSSARGPRPWGSRAPEGALSGHDVRSSQTRDRTSVPGLARRTLKPLDHQGSPSDVSYLIHSPLPTFHQPPARSEEKLKSSQRPARLFPTQTPGTL